MTGDLDLDRIIASIEAARSASATPATDQATALARIRDAQRAATRLEALAHHLVAHFVDQARQHGASWTSIGGALGVTRQAAQQRFVPSVTGGLESALERGALPYSARARTALLAARTVAIDRGDPTLEDVHLLIGLLATRRGVVADLIKACGLRVADVRRSAWLRLSRDDQSAVRSAPRTSGQGEPALSRSISRVLDVATREALRMARQEVGTEHLLLGLAADQDPTARSALAEAGLDYATLRREVVAYAARSHQSGRKAQRAPRTRTTQRAGKTQRSRKSQRTATTRQRRG
ncbi:MAG TPA: Clp protease N-terminal domain-containing protein [Actinopolymorphaceae bacterium]|jgi:hypothetical protein